MATCPDKETIISYVEGRLPKEETQELQRHFGFCAKCREMAEITKRRKEF